MSERASQLAEEWALAQVWESEQGLRPALASG